MRARYSRWHHQPLLENRPQRTPRLVREIINQNVNLATRKEDMAPSSSSDAPFFIIGSDRSGTTMFRLMLNRHSRLYVPPETWFLTDLMNRLPCDVPLTEDQKQLAFKIVTEHWRWKEWEVDDIAFRDALRLLDGPTLAELVDALYRLYSGEKPRWGDKTPGYVHEINRLHRLLPCAKFIHVIRDGRDVCLSLRGTGWRGDVTWPIGRYWSECVSAGCAQGRALPRGLYAEIAYEDLVLNTEGTVRRVCEFLEEPFEPEMLEFYSVAEQHIPARALDFHRKTQRPPRASDVHRWRREMGTLQILIFEAAAADTMRRVSQQTRFRHSLVPVRWVCRLVAFVAGATLPARRRLGLHFPRLRKRF